MDGKHLMIWAAILAVLVSVTACRSANSDDDDFRPDADDDNEASPAAIWSPPCQPPHDPPTGYHPYEAVWMVAQFDDESLPFRGLYAYAWIDRYRYDGCSYTSANTVLYGRERDNLAAGGCTSGYRIGYGAPFDLLVSPALRVTRTALVPPRYFIEFLSPAIGGWIEVQTERLYAWNLDYFAFYDAQIIAGELRTDNATFTPCGRVDFERWNEIGGGDPTDASEGILQGYWLYSPLFWQDETGARLTTLTWHWVDVIDGEDMPHDVRGVLALDDEVLPIAEQTVDFAFPENEAGDGYLLRHAFHGELENGEEFSYQVHVVQDYRDRLPPTWEALIDPVDRRQHPYVEGTLTFRGRTFTGGGTSEWRVTAENPLVE